MFLLSNFKLLFKVSKKFILYKWFLGSWWLLWWLLSCSSVICSLSSDWSWSFWRREVPQGSWFWPLSQCSCGDILWSAWWEFTWTKFLIKVWWDSASRNILKSCRSSYALDFFCDNFFLCFTCSLFLNSLTFFLSLQSFISCWIFEIFRGFICGFLFRLFWSCLAISCLWRWTLLIILVCAWASFSFLWSHIVFISFCACLFCWLLWWGWSWCTLTFTFIWWIKLVLFCKFGALYFCRQIF